MPRIAGTSSSAATKCISEVPGLAKHTSTPASTSVQSSERAPFTTPLPSACRPSSRSGPRIPCGSKMRLMDRISSSDTGSSSSRK